MSDKVEDQALLKSAAMNAEVEANFPIFEQARPFMSFSLLGPCLQCF
jgi:hypothetical protein